MHISYSSRIFELVSGKVSSSPAVFRHVTLGGQGVTKATQKQKANPNLLIIKLKRMNGNKSRELRGLAGIILAESNSDIPKRTLYKRLKKQYKLEIKNKH